MSKLNKKDILSAVAKFFKELKPSKKLLSQNFMLPAIAVAGIIITVAIVGFSGGLINFKFLGITEHSSSQEIAQKTITYINEKILKGQSTAVLIDAIKEDGFIKVRFKIGTNETIGYTTIDGKLFFPQAYNLDEKAVTGNTGGTTAETANNNAQKTSCEEIKKDKKALLEAFVVSKCPFGLQMQRVLAEVVKNIPSLVENIKVEYLGSISGEKITSMHGDAEAQENLRQICIREEEGSKYWNYISCHIKKGDMESCLVSAKINTSGLNACMTDSSRGLKYAQVDFDLQKKYGANGSPTMFLNGERGSEFWFGGRTAEAVKTLLCCGFSENLEICSQKLSEKSAASSFSEQYESSQQVTPSGSAGGGCQ
ncbi:hypothetical protein KJ786_02940 [Patescibacteria group bacterium]|nr:hypothetical protein [Patescibacteria group bacterium]